MTFRTSDGDRDKFDHSLHHYTAKKFDHSNHYYPEKIIYPEDKQYKKELECNSISFGAANSYINCGNDSSLRPTDAITILLGINIRASSIYRGVFSKKSETDWGSKGYSISITPSYKLFFRLNAATAHSDTALSPGRSYDVACVWAKNNPLHVYLDGIETTYSVQDTLNVDIINSIIDCRVGIYHSGGCLTGDMNYISMYKRVLSVNEIINRQQNIPISNNNLVLDLPLKTDHSGDTVVKDLSGNDNDGTLIDCGWNCEWIKKR